MKTGRTTLCIWVYTKNVAIWKALVCAELWKGARAEVEAVRTCWQFHSSSTCWVYGGVVYEWTRNLLEYVSPCSYNMKYTLLELIGLASIGTVSWFVFREVWKFMYSTFIGHALGRSLSLKNIGQWAGRSNTSSILWFDKSMIIRMSLTSCLFFKLWPVPPMELVERTQKR